MGRRVELQTKFEELLGSSNVYFQPPESIKLTYPCIIYTRGRYRPMRADNGAYVMRRPYSVTAIYRDPDSDLPERIASLPYCSHERHYTADNLYHDAFTLYF